MPEQIRYAQGQSRLGAFIGATSDRGLVAFEFADRQDALLGSVQARLPDATLVEDATGLADLITGLAAVADGRDPGADLPLDARGSEFEHAVWARLRAIPPGETTTYGAIAASLGQARASREVGEACAANPIALLVPCHRVVKKDGTLGNYRWGYARKRALLAREQRPFALSG